MYMKNKGLRLFCAVLVSFVLMSGCGKSQEVADTSGDGTKTETKNEAGSDAEAVAGDETEAGTEVGTESETTKNETTTEQETESKEVNTESNTSNIDSQGSELEIVQNIIKSIITNNMNELEKAKAIHDYMVMNIDYDYENYRKNTIPDTSRTVVGTLTTKYAVCQGYALTFQALCEAAGLEVVYVSGTATNIWGITEGHAWNQIKINNKWYNVDVTWDDPLKSSGDSFDNHSNCRYDYFLISDEILYKDHVADNAKYTCSESLYMDVIKMGCPWNGYTYVTSMDEIYEAVVKGVNNNASEFVFLMDEDLISVNELQNFIDDTIEKCNVYKDYIKHGSSYKETNAFGLIKRTFTYELNNGVYTKVQALTTLDRTKEEIRKASNSLSGSTEKITHDIYLSKELANTTNLRENLISWAERELGIYLIWSTTDYASDTISRFVVTQYKMNYATSYEQAEAYIKELAEVGKKEFTYMRTSIYIKLDYSNIPLEKPDTYSQYAQYTYAESLNDFINEMVEKHGVTGQYEQEMTNSDAKVAVFRFDKAGTVNP